MMMKMRTATLLVLSLAVAPGLQAQDAPTRANKRWKKMLAEYEAPEIDPGVDEALRDYVQRKKDAMPDSNV